MIKYITGLFSSTTLGFTKSELNCLWCPVSANYIIRRCVVVVYDNLKYLINIMPSSKRSLQILHKIVLNNNPKNHRLKPARISREREIKYLWMSWMLSDLPCPSIYFIDLPSSATYIYVFTSFF